MLPARCALEHAHRGQLAGGRAQGITPLYARGDVVPRPHRMSRICRISRSVYGSVLMMSSLSSRSMGMPWGDLHVGWQEEEGTRNGHQC
jgi:hypothetical protein